jgi:hypothetical protein|tara:strand:- start:84655 stop:84831 length:177 start_codon:yes stop_codon:yes gene_type:complete
MKQKHHNIFYILTAIIIIIFLLLLKFGYLDKLGSNKIKGSIVKEIKIFEKEYKKKKFF